MQMVESVKKTDYYDSGSGRGHAVTALEGGERREVTAAALATTPAAVALIVHGSSMEDTLSMRRGMAAFVQTMKNHQGSTRLALVTTIDRITFLDVKADYATFEGGIARFVTPARGLILFEAVRAACRALKQETTDRRAIVVFTNPTWRDPEREASATVIAALREANASLSVVDVPPPPGFAGGSSRFNQEVIDLFERDLQTSGGIYMPLRTTLTFPDVASRIARIIASQYAVTFVRPAAAKAGPLRIGVGGKAGDVVLGPTWPRGQ